MPWSVFFNEGIAVHQAPEGTEGGLGSRASGGCIRISKRVAQGVYGKVLATGQSLAPEFTRAGDPVLDAQGNFKMKKGWKTLVIVEDVIE